MYNWTTWTSTIGAQNKQPKIQIGNHETQLLFGYTYHSVCRNKIWKEKYCLVSYFFLWVYLMYQICVSLSVNIVAIVELPVRLLTLSDHTNRRFSLKKAQSHTNAGMMEVTMPASELDRMRHCVPKNSSGAFSRWSHSHTSDLMIGTPVATLPGTWCYRVSLASTETGWLGVSILLLGEIGSLIDNFSVGVAPVVCADLSLRYNSMWQGRYTGSQQQSLHRQVDVPISLQSLCYCNYYIYMSQLKLWEGGGGMTVRVRLLHAWWYSHLIL